MKGFRPRKDPVNPTPPMPRGETDFEEAQIKRDFLAVFLRISKSLFHSHQETHEYAYRAGFSAGKSRRGIGTPKAGYPSHMGIDSLTINCGGSQ